MVRLSKGKAKINDFIDSNQQIVVKFSIYYEQNSLTLSPKPALTGPFLFLNFQFLILNLTMLTFPNAKINLGLNITEKRPDGYHNLETISLFPWKMRWK